MTNFAIGILLSLLTFAVAGGAAIVDRGKNVSQALAKLAEEKLEKSSSKEIEDKVGELFEALKKLGDEASTKVSNLAKEVLKKGKET